MDILLGFEMWLPRNGQISSSFWCMIQHSNLNRPSATQHSAIRIPSCSSVFIYLECAYIARRFTNDPASPSSFGRNMLIWLGDSLTTLLHPLHLVETCLHGLAIRYPPCFTFFIWWKHAYVARRSNPPHALPCSFDGNMLTCLAKRA